MPRSTRSSPPFYDKPDSPLFYDEPDSDSYDRKPSAEIRHQSVDQSPVRYNLISPEVDDRVAERTRGSVVAEPRSENNRMESTISCREGTGGNSRPADFNTALVSWLKTCIDHHPESYATLKNLVQEPENNLLRQEHKMLERNLATIVSTEYQDVVRAIEKMKEKLVRLEHKRDQLNARMLHPETFRFMNCGLGSVGDHSTVVRGRSHPSPELPPARRQRLDDGNAPN